MSALYGRHARRRWGAPCPHLLDPCRPARINAGLSGLLEPRQQTTQPSPLADHTGLEMAAGGEPGQRCWPVSRHRRTLQAQLRSTSARQASNTSPGLSRPGPGCVGGPTQPLWSNVSGLASWLHPTPVQEANGLASWTRGCNRLGPLQPPVRVAAPVNSDRPRSFGRVPSRDPRGRCPYLGHLHWARDRSRSLTGARSRSRLLTVIVDPCRVSSGRCTVSGTPRRRALPCRTLLVVGQ